MPHEINDSVNVPHYLTAEQCATRFAISLRHFKYLDAELPQIVLRNRDSKNSEGGVLPLHSMLVQHLREWLELRGNVTPKDKLFNVYSSLSHVLNRDLAFAGIEKRDALDRVIDVIQKLTGLEYKKSFVHKFLVSLGYSFRKTGGIPAKANIGKQEEFKKNA